MILGWTLVSKSVLLVVRLLNPGIEIGWDRFMIERFWLVLLGLNEYSLILAYLSSFTCEFELICEFSIPILSNITLNLFSLTSLYRALASVKPLFSDFDLDRVFFIDA
jgi:hypothetical protein